MPWLLSNPSIAASKRVDRLLMLGMGVEFAVLPDAINFVDKDNRRLVSGRLFEKLANALGADTDKDLGKIAPVHTEKLGFSFAGNSLGEHRLASAGRADEKHPFGKGASEALVFLGVAEEIHDLLNLALGFLNPPPHL